MSADLPLHLQDLVPPGRRYGYLDFDEETQSFVMVAEPQVCDLAVRCFWGKSDRHFESKENPGHRSVSFPRTRQTVGNLLWFMMRYPLEVRCGDRLERGKEAERARERRRQGLEKLEPVTDPPGFLGKLKQYQAEGVAFLLANKRALLADEMGLGKTVVGLAAAAENGQYPVVVVVQPSVQRQWRKMVGAFLDRHTPGITRRMRLSAFEEGEEKAEAVEDRAERMVHIIRGLTPYELPKRLFYVIHYGLLAAWADALEALKPAAFIFDEIQDLRHTGTLKYSAASRLADGAENVWGLSGTPIYNRGGEIWNVTNILEPNCLGDFQSFTREWGDGWGSMTVRDPELLGRHLRDEGLLLRREKKEVQKDLPPKHRVVTEIDSDEDVFANLVRNAASLAAQYHGVKGWAERGRMIREIENEARQACGVAKAPYVAKFVAALVEAGERVVVCAHHHEVHRILMEGLKKHQPVRITGAESMGQKEEAVRAFAEGKTPVVLLALRSAAGLDGLQSKGTCIVFAELDWSPAIHAQAEDRLQRIGVDKAVESIMAYYLVSEFGTDQTMLDALGLKIGQFNGIMLREGESEAEKALSAKVAQDRMESVVAQLAQLNRQVGTAPRAMPVPTGAG